jgi:hypothetical protein
MNSEKYIQQNNIEYEHKARAAGQTPSACLVHVFVFLIKVFP